MTCTEPQGVASIIRDAGGCVVGKTRLQKIAYLLSIVDAGECSSFVYSHYGPYSEELASVARSGALLGYFTETEHQSDWGGNYSVYSIEACEEPDLNSPRVKLAHLANEADAVALELAATAIFLAREGYSFPWEETWRRKRDKATEKNVDFSVRLFEAFRSVVPEVIPVLNRGGEE